MPSFRFQCNDINVTVTAQCKYELFAKGFLPLFS